MFGHAFTSSSHGAPPASSTKSYRTSSNRSTSAVVPLDAAAEAAAAVVASTTDSIRERTRSHRRGDSCSSRACTLGAWPAEDSPVASDGIDHAER